MLISPGKQAPAEQSLNAAAAAELLDQPFYSAEQFADRLGATRTVAGVMPSQAGIQRLQPCWWGCREVDEAGANSQPDGRRSMTYGAARASTAMSPDPGV